MKPETKFYVGLQTAKGIRLKEVPKDVYDLRVGIDQTKRKKTTPEIRVVYDPAEAKLETEADAMYHSDGERFT